MARHAVAAACVLCVALLLAPAPARASTFTDVTAAAGLAYQHGYASPAKDEPRRTAGGVAAGDYDGDGWIDLYVARGDIGPNLLFHNRGDGTFEEVGAAAGVALAGVASAGPTFADVDGDGHLDLLVLGVAGTSPTLFRNRGDGTFEDVTAASGLTAVGNSFSAAFGDYDRDGDLDVFISHWGTTLPAGTADHLWRNDGQGHFTNVTVAAGLPRFVSALFPDVDMTFTPNFADIDDDGWPDLLVSSDFGTSRVLHNERDGTFRDVTSPVISDENGMGGAIADYDGDGHLDWFVSSIWASARPPGARWGSTGNRLYRNRGDGTFEDATDAAGVRVGYWGWGSTFADLDDDGRVDLVEVNGWGGPGDVAGVLFGADPSRIFVANTDGTFTERSADLGVDDTRQGRGVVAFDYDRDGDLDLFVANNQAAPRLLRNDGGDRGGHLTVRLRGPSPNTEGIGARVTVTAGRRRQMRELRAGSNFVSQDPAEAHFGLGSATVVDDVEVRWPDGAVTTLHAVAGNQLLTIVEPPPGADAACGCGVCEAAACTGRRVPRGVATAIERACRLLAAAGGASGAPDHAARLRKADRSWRKAGRAITRGRRRRLAKDCASALRDVVRTRRGDIRASRAPAG